jgi:hypothetical protein
LSDVWDTCMLWFSLHSGDELSAYAFSLPLLLNGPPCRA